MAGFRKADRAHRTDDFLRLLPDLLSGQPVRVPDLPGMPDVRLLPSVPLPPLWIGGTSRAALRRAANLRLRVVLRFSGTCGVRCLGGMPF